MILTPERLTQPIAPGVPEAFLGADAGPPLGHAAEKMGSKHRLPKRLIFKGTTKGPLACCTAALPKEELDLVVGRLNTTREEGSSQSLENRAISADCRGVLTCIVGVMRFSFALIRVGMLLLAVGGFGKVRAFPLRGGGNALTALWERALGAQCAVQPSRH